VEQWEGGLRRWPQRVTIAASCDEGDNDKDASNSDEELIAIAERDFKRQARQSADHLEKLLDATYPNHTYRIRHKLKECTMVKNYMTTWTFGRSKKPEGDWMGKAAAPFPEGKVAMSSYCRLPPPPIESRCKLKLINQAINIVCTTVLEYLC
jgi:hypothetical protein